MIVFLIFSVIFLVVGVFTLTQATQGVGWLAVAILLAIFARIGQAATQHRELLKRPSAGEQP